jgi:hypothetical protein
VQPIPEFYASVDIFLTRVATIGGPGLNFMRCRLRIPASISLMTIPAEYSLTRQVFLRSLAIIYLVAFCSLWVQIDGLGGVNGILPIRTLLNEAQSIWGIERYWHLPTLCWLSSSNWFLHMLCGGGALASILIIAGFGQLPALIVAWVFYLSLCVAGQDFLEFQWDILLTEAGLLAIFFAAGRKTEPSQIILWLLRWLVFRVMFMSGVVKLSSGDPNWRDLSALQYHYWTQPLPTWTAWYLAQCPAWFQYFSCGVVFFAELVVPPFVFAPRFLRLPAFWIIVCFQLLVAATGNFGFFNFLTIVLCFTLPDDKFWRWILRRKAAAAPAAKAPRWRRYVYIPVAALLLSVTIPDFVDCFGYQIFWPWPLPDLARLIGPLRSANGYGLFAIMTTSRPELVIEGSDDGRTWKEYSFKWKMGDVNRRPAFMEPHMPRLDWQMWFAALGGPNDSPWLYSFMERLADGSPDVLGLMAANPFPDHPPLYVRAVMYNYEFTDRAERAADGAWWKRQEIGVFGEVSRREP